MWNTAVSPEDAIAYLNDIVTHDPEALMRLIEHRVPCNAVLAMHPTVQVAGDPTGTTVGLLGILNGLFGVDERGWGPITAHFDTGLDGEVTKLTHFSLTKHR